MQKQIAASGKVLVQLRGETRRQVARIVQKEHRSTAAYLESLVERDLAERVKRERAVRIYVSCDAPEWSGMVERGQDETAEEHVERDDVLRQLFGRD